MRHPTYLEYLTVVDALGHLLDASVGLIHEGSEEDDTFQWVKETYESARAVIKELEIGSGA
jgi:hypothetical protein